MSNLSPRISRLEKNIIINGAMDFFQRGTSATSLSATWPYRADRFAAMASWGTSTMAQSTDIPADKVSASLIVSTSANASPAAGRSSIRYIVEGYDYLPISNGKKITLSFWIKSSMTGTYSIAFANASSDRSLVKEYTISSANTWEKKYIQIETDTAGTWDYINGTGLTIYFAFGAATDTSTSTLGVWQGANYRSSTNTVNLAGTTGQTFYLSGVMLYEGWTENSGFYRAGRTIQEELALCQRYYYKIGADNTAVGYGYALSSDTSISISIPTCQMRSAPVIASSSVSIIGTTSTTKVPTAYTAVSNLSNSVSATATVTTGIGTYRPVMLYCNSSVGYITLDAEF